jgi:Flp pilus assembly protein TadB
VPAAQFGAALDQIRNAGSRVIQEKVTGQDVTEEFIDLEARIKTQKALELQFLEIMKQAHKVEDALEVQRQIADVRTEIEKLEGRKRFLENRASLSTITVNLLSPTAIAVNTSGFGRSIREALAEGVDVAIAIVLFLIRFVIVMIPIVLLLILPLWLVARFIFRRARKNRQARVETPKSPGPPERPIDSQSN